MIRRFMDAQATWVPVRCCLADHSDYLWYTSLVEPENTALPGCKLSVFAELG